MLNIGLFLVCTLYILVNYYIGYRAFIFTKNSFNIIISILISIIIGILTIM